MDKLISLVLGELFPFIIIALVVKGIASANKKKTAKKAAAHPFGASPVKPQPAAPQQPQPYIPAQPTVAPTLSSSDASAQVIVPTVHTHVEPDCDTHDTPGSLGVTDDEGKDPCHEEQLTHTRTIEEPAPEHGGLTFHWSGENMVNAVIMQEVLTRPCQRRAR